MLRTVIKTLHNPHAAGERTRRAGVYNITHQGHRQSHVAIVQEGELLPTCRLCGQGVMFEYLRPASEREDVEHIGYDLDFLDSVLGAARRVG